ncbi:hypothetical protein HGA13_12250 [Nocardia speluncae]|uniref:DUF8176 domain-containing protein n=1 Tax=Nocardia speluncae TaxID=419477 RepID=A0A846XJ52_9NOCA|nr:hypothetical protein [Nocardia speluncae]NKY33844.1 hypothetical protein [Nocardia speluncae]
MRYPDTPPDDENSWVRLDEPRPTSTRHAVPGPDLPPDLDPDPELPGDRWLGALPRTPDAADTGGYRPWWATVRHRLPAGAWAVLAAVVAILIGVVAVSVNSGGAGQEPVTTATPPSAAPAPEDACTGLSGMVVTDRAGDPATVPGVIASFQAAYYLSRDAEAAMRLLAPESGIAFDGLAAGIVSIPRGTTHCVAITPISSTTANVHIVELRADRQRIDYLQVVNTRPSQGGALLISNIQRQG